MINYVHEYNEWKADDSLRERLKIPGMMSKYFKSIQHECKHADGETIHGYRVVFNVNNELIGCFLDRLTSNDYVLALDSFINPMQKTLWHNWKYKPTYANGVNNHHAGDGYYMFTDYEVCMQYMKCIAWKTCEHMQYKNIKLEMYECTGVYHTPTNEVTCDVNVNEGITCSDITYNECVCTLNCADAFNK